MKRTQLVGGSALLALLVLAGNAMAQQVDATGPVFTTLYQFDLYNLGPASPSMNGLIQGTDGNLYGATAYGGGCAEINGGCGTIYKITPTGQLTVLHQFEGTDGATPNGALLQAPNGDFYGVTSAGGIHNSGVAFSITPSGTYTVLHYFTGSDGSDIFGPLVIDAAGNLYGTASLGGANSNGTVFRLSPSGKLTTLHTFSGTDGSFPAALIQAENGGFIGVCSMGGSNGWGSVFEISLSGKFETIFSFDYTNGADPTGVVQGASRVLYGTSCAGGTSLDGTGTVFSLTLGGNYKVLYDFSSASGYAPYATVVQGTDRLLYGTTFKGGNEAGGSVFAITPAGRFTSLENFPTYDGGPESSLLQATNGLFYGTTFGGNGAGGQIFSMNVGLAPFISVQPILGPAGSTVTILGDNLTGATSVSFNGLEAAFTVNSATYITATVPSGATTGTVKVVTPTATLASNTNFTVN